MKHGEVFPFYGANDRFAHPSEARIETRSTVRARASAGIASLTRAKRGLKLYIATPCDYLSIYRFAHPSEARIETTSACCTPVRSRYRFAHPSEARIETSQAFKIGPAAFHRFAHPSEARIETAHASTCRQGLLIASLTRAKRGLKHEKTGEWVPHWHIASLTRAKRGLKLSM